jgi:glycosyltransferase involved in cell wall biosynthesis
MKHEDYMLKSKRAIFTGPARNCAQFLPAVLQNIERLAALYRDSAIVIAENDSDDATKAILRSWLADRPNGVLIELDGLATTALKRTERIAAARNAALDYIRSSPFGNWDHFVQLDLDDVNTHPISCLQFEDAANFLEHNPLTAAVFANQPVAYYDMWTLRCRGWCNSDCWKQVETAPKWMRRELAEVIYVYSRQVAIPEQSQPIRVKSAFGGLAIYKLSSIGDCRYQGLYPDGTEVCDHVMFNEKIAAGGKKLFIYPGLLNRSPKDHLFNPRRVGRRDKLALILLRSWREFVLILMRSWRGLSPPWRQVSWGRKSSRMPGQGASSDKTA